MNILHLDSSITGELSVSRRLTTETVVALVARFPDSEVTYHDLAKEPVMHLSPQHLAAFQGGPIATPALEQDIALGARFIDELFAADVLVIGVPMYNFGLPTQLKAWLDRVVVAGRTFRYTESGPEGLLPAGKKAFLVATSGGFYSSDSPAKFLEHSLSHLEGALAHIGISDVTVIRAEGIGLGPEARSKAIEKSLRAIGELTTFKRAA